MTTPSTSQEPLSSVNAGQSKKGLDLLWKEFRTDMKQIFETEPKEMTKYKIMKMYTIIYDILIWSKSLKPWDSKQYADELYSEIKEHLKEFLSKKMLTGQELKGEELLQFYSNLWKNYNYQSRSLNAGTGYLNRFYIRLAEDYKIKREVLEIYWLALISWKEMVFDVLHIEVTSAVLDLIEKERRGERIDTSGISGAISSYVQLGLVDKKEKDFTLAESIARRIKRKESHLTIYLEYFEKDFLMTAESFYVKEAVDFLKENMDFDEFTQKMGKYLKEDEKRVELYLDKSTFERLKKRFQNVCRIISDSSF